MYVPSISLIGYLYQPFCLSPFQLAHTLPLNITAIIPAHPFQDHLHVRLSVALHGDSVSLDPRAMNPPSFSNARYNLSCLMMILPMSKFLMDGATRYAHFCLVNECCSTGCDVDLLVRCCATSSSTTLAGLFGGYARSYSCVSSGSRFITYFSNSCASVNYPSSLLHTPSPS